MKIAEQATLRDYVESVDRICEKFLNARQFYKNISLVPDFSLQNIAFEKDMEFLKEVSSVLSVITSIIAHPHISNKREEIVIRIEQARQIQQDAFRQVLMDSSLWKEHNGRMVPEEVYYYQHVDELRIYENQFICMLIDLLDIELAKCNSFYVLKLPNVDAGLNVDFAPLSTSISPENCALAIKRAEELRRRVRFIKNTNFYKVVSKGKGISKIIKPTNILLKDRLYRKCFKFYRQFVRYENQQTLKEDMAKYASVIVLKVLGDLGFNLTSVAEGRYRLPTGVIRKLVKRSGQKIVNGVIESEEDNEIAVNRAIAPFFNGATFKFEKNGFNIVCSYMPQEQGIRLDVKYGELEGVSHVLLFDGGEDNFTVNGGEDFLTVDIFSIWNSFVWENKRKRLLKGDYNEVEMIKQWILSKLTVIVGDKDVYAKYCPACKNKSVEVHENGGLCADCGAIFTYISELENTSKIWLKKIRRV